MYTIVVLLHVLACMALILIVLLQTGKGAEMGAAFGGASQTLFGGSGGATFLGKLTTGAAIVFMITCLGLTYLSTGPQTKSIMEDVPVAATEQPLVPEAKPIQPAPASEPAAAPQPAPKPEVSAVPVLPEKTAPQAQPATQPQQPAKEETKPAPAKPQEKRPEKPAAGAKN